MTSPSDTVGKDIMFLDCPVHPFVQSDIIATMCHERLEQVE